MAKRSKKTEIVPRPEPDCGSLVTGISDLLEHARWMSARSVNSILTAAYWEIGCRIVEYEQGGRARAEYGQALVETLAWDLSGKHGRGFSVRNVWNMKGFYLGWEIVQTPSAQFQARVRPNSSEGEACQMPSGQSPAVEIVQMASAESPLPHAAILSTPLRESPLPPVPASPSSSLEHFALIGAFPLFWSQYVRLMSVTTAKARAFYEAEAIRGGWSVRQLDRQINTQFYERSSHSKRQAAMLARGQIAKPEDAMTVEDEVRDPYLLEFLNLKDEYSENELEEALIRHLEWFLLELGAGFTFVARQKRIRIGGVLVSDRLAALSSRAAMPGCHRPKDRRVHTRRRRADESVSELCQAAPYAAGRG